MVCVTTLCCGHSAYCPHFHPSYHSLALDLHKKISLFYLIYFVSHIFLNKTINLNYLFKYNNKFNGNFGQVFFIFVRKTKWTKVVAKESYLQLSELFLGQHWVVWIWEEPRATWIVIWTFCHWLHCKIAHISIIFTSNLNKIKSDLIVILKRVVKTNAY